MHRYSGSAKGPSGSDQLKQSGDIVTLLHSWTASKIKLECTQKTDCLDENTIPPTKASPAPLVSTI